MEAVVEAITGFFVGINAWLWGIPLLVVLLGTHIFMTIRTGFIQRKIPLGIKLSLERSSKEDAKAAGDVSQFGALMTALAPTIGTGNIVGVGTAIALGGPGAVLWVWLTGVFGIATKYAECYIGVKYRVRAEDGSMLGGAMYALERGLKCKWLGIVFAFLTMVASLGIGSMVQANAVATVTQENTGIATWIVGIILLVLSVLVIFGGLKKIAKVCEFLVPIMAVGYVLGCIVILAINWAFIIPAIQLICVSAFTPHAVGGGFVGAAVMEAARYGVARGLFSNESGMGSAPIVAAAARTKNPARQALVSMTGTFWDTVVVCLATGLVLVTTVMASGAETQALFQGGADGLNPINGSTLTSTAFAQIPYLGIPLLVFGMITFAYSTILGWSYYGDRCATYLFGKKALIPYRAIYCATVFLGTLGSVGLVWEMADTFNGLMVIPNLIAVLGLSAVIVKETRHFVYKDNLDDDALEIEDALGAQ